MDLPMNSRIFTLVCMMLLFLAGTAMAHKVMVFAWVEGDTVYGESKFSGGTRAKGAQVIVLDAEGEELLQTRTDENGEFSFKVPEHTELLIKLNAGMGHQAEWTIPLEELGEAEPQRPSPADPGSAASAQTAVRAIAPGPADMARFEDLIQKTVDKALDKKMRPMMAVLADLKQEGPSAGDIFGGIGYIFGLMGVAMYFKARQRKG